MPQQDWFSANAPKAPQAAQPPDALGGADWFSSNAPDQPTRGSFGKETAGALGELGLGALQFMSTLFRSGGGQGLASAEMARSVIDTAREGARKVGEADSLTEKGARSLALLRSLARSSDT